MWKLVTYSVITVELSITTRPCNFATTMTVRVEENAVKSLNTSSPSAGVMHTSSSLSCSGFSALCSSKLSKLSDSIGAPVIWEQAIISLHTLKYTQHYTQAYEFNRVFQAILFEKLLERNVPKYIVHLLRVWYANDERKVGFIYSFIVMFGAKQCSILSPYVVRVLLACCPGLGWQTTNYVITSW